MSDRRPTDEQLAHWVEYEDFDLSADDATEVVEAMADELLELRRTLNSIVLEAAQRPPLGYIVLAKRLTSTIVPRYTTAGGIWDEREPVDSHRDHCEDSAAADPERFGTDVEYLVAEVREVKP